MQGLAGAKARFVQSGNDPKDFRPGRYNISTESNYVKLGSKKLAIIKMKAKAFGSVVSVTNVVGIVGQEIRKVGCMITRDEDVLWWEGDCGNKVREELGVSVNP